MNQNGLDNGTRLVYFELVNQYGSFEKEDEMADVGGFSQMKLRIPCDLKQWLKLAAKKNRRSENSEVVVRLEESKALEEKMEAQASINAKTLIAAGKH